LLSDHGLVPQQLFFWPLPFSPTLPVSQGSINGRKPFGVPDNNLTEAKAISSKKGMIASHLGIWRKYSGIGQNNVRL
jgi:hypothetical protein